MMFRKLLMVLATLALGWILQSTSDAQAPLPPLRIPTPRMVADDALDFRSAPELDTPTNVIQRRAKRQPSALAGPLSESVEAASRDQNSRIKRIREKLDKLKQLSSSRRQQEEKPPQNEAPQNEAPQLVGPAPPPTLPIEEPPLPARQAPLEKIKSIQSGDDPEFEADNSLLTLPVQLTSTVDRLALANNLFAQNKTERAMSIYEALLQLPQKGSDLVWIRYQLASCHRLQGNVKAATKLYRIVAGANEEEYWASRASWWLGYLERANSQLERQQELQSKLNALQKEFDETRKP